MSRGLQRFFADGERILLVDKQSMQARLVGTRDAFARRNFCSYLADGAWSDDIEDQWRQIENECLPAVRRLIDGDRSVDPIHVKALAAVHYVRNYAFEAKFHQIFAQVVAEAQTDMPLRPGAQAAFASDFGRAALPGEIGALVNDRFTELQESRAWLIQEMAEGFNKTMKLLAPFHVQFVWPKNRDRHFILGDVPLVHSAKDGRLGALGGVALGDADRAFLPLAPHLLALFTSEKFVDCPLRREQVIQLNRQTWRCAMRLVAASPTTNIKRSTEQWKISRHP